MRTRIAFKIALISIFSLSVSAQTSVPKLPTRAECEVCANKKAGTLLEKYGTAEKFIGCLVAGGTSAQMVQIDNLLKTAEAKQKKFSYKSSTPSLRYMILRNVRSYTNLVDYGADFAMKFPFESDYIKGVMAKHFNQQKARAQELRDWANRMQAILDKDHPDTKKGMQGAIFKKKMDCDITWNNAKNGFIYPENLFFDREKSNEFVVGCAEVDMNFYDLLRTPAPKKYAATKPKKKPTSTGKQTIGSWNVFWTNSFFTLRPKLYDKQKLLSDDLRIEYYDKTGKYSIAFNYDSGNFSADHVQLIYIDGDFFQKGKWTIERYPDGRMKSARAPAIHQNLIDIFKLGSEVEIKVMGKKMVDDPSSGLGYKWQPVLEASAKFSLKDFTRALEVAQAGKASKSNQNSQGK